MKQGKTQHYDIMTKVINDRQIKVVAEIGVWKSRFTRNLLSGCDCIKEYWAVDQWILLGPEHGRMHKLTAEDWDICYRACCGFILKFPQLRVLRMKSLEAVEIFPNGYFDMVYIDASHFYEDAKEDILAWLPKVKKGGLISGHDYGTSRPEHKGVGKAIDEIFGVGVVSSGRCWTWWKEI